eukprot:871765_1
MGSCGTKIPKDHHYSTHQILQNASDDEDDGKQADACNSTKHYSESSNQIIHPNTSQQAAQNSAVYNNLINMGCDKRWSLEAAAKYPTNMNNAIDFVTLH